MPASYFQGTSVHGPVKESAARNFKEVVETLRICPVLPISRSAFLALAKRERNEIKQVPFFVPATFKESPSKRTYDQAVHANLIFLDIDELPDGRCPAAPFVRNPELLKRQLAGFNFAAHVTASSTKEKPRMRVVVEANAIPLSEYPRAVATIGALLGLPAITRESSVAVQPMFLPTLFNDSLDDETPMLAYCTTAKAFQHSDISDSLDSYNGANGKNGHKPVVAPGADALDYLRAPVDGVSLSIAKEALFTIDPDCDRDRWRDCASALRHQFSPHKDEEAYALFDEWSQTGKTKYDGEDSSRAMWKSLRPSPNGRLPITIRSLMHWATEAGWDDKRVKESLFHEALRWMEEVPTVTDLMERGVQRIVATPLLTSMQEDMLVSQISTQAKKRFSYPLSPTSIRKDLQRIKQEKRALETPEKSDVFPKWAEGVIYVQATQEFYRRRTGERLKGEAFNAAYSRWLMPTKAELIASGSQVNDATLSTPKVSPTFFALNNLQIPTAYDYAYNPSKPMDVWFVDRGCRFVNTYVPTYPQADAKHAAAAGALLIRHLEHLIAEPENRRIMLDFMATLVQVPGRKIRWCPLIQSVEGGGKTFLAEVMKAVLGHEHVKTLDGGSVKSGWNEWAFGKQLVVLEEVKVDGTNKYEIMNALKPLITNDDISVNERFRNNRQVSNISNYMIFSNHHNALALTPGDRRYFVIKSPLQSKAQVLALGDDYFPPLYAMLREHPGAMRSFLQDWEISPDFRADGHAPRTSYVNEMVADSATDLTATIRRMLIEGDFPLVQYDIVSAATLKNALQLEGIDNATTQKISQVLREEGLLQVGRHLIGDERMYLWARPGITETEAFETAVDRVKRGLKNLQMDLIY